MDITRLINAVLKNVFAKSSNQKSTEPPAVCIDSQTGLLTKAGLVHAASKVLLHGRLMPRSYAAISVVLDNLNIDDASANKLTGSLVIREVAHRIRMAVRTEDIVARTEDDEFVILMPQVASEVAVLNIANRIQDAVSQPILGDQLQMFPSLTIGISMSNDEHNPAFEEMLCRSNQALQQAKLICRGAIHFFDSNLTGELDRRKEIEQDLCNAASNNELLLHYQPIYDIEQAMISHVEALVRWQHPEFGLVPPNDFIPVAESSGTIQSIGMWVLQQAFSDLEIFDKNGLDGIDVSVNLSPSQLKLTNIVDEIEKASSYYPVHKGRIALEVTEDVVIDERYQMAHKLQSLRDAGFKIFLDDFGAGNASIGRLRNLKFDAIKIDRSLVTNLDQNQSDLAIVRLILLLAESLGLSAIAEGVETQSCLDILSRENCRFAQGYYFSRPLPLAEAIDVIHQGFETSNPTKVAVSI